MHDDSVILDPKMPSHSELIEKVLPFAQPLMCPKGKTLLTTGARADCFYFIESGKFEVSYRAQQTRIVVALIGSDTFLGEIGYFDQLTRTRHVTAIQDAALKVFNADVMEAIRTRKPDLYADFMRYLLGLVCRRFRQVLADQGPLSAYAASLSTGREQFKGLKALPSDLIGSKEWKRVSSQIEDFKTALFDISYRLQKDDSDHIPADVQADGEALLETFKHQVRHYQDNLAQEHIALMWGYVFKELFPYFMRSRFAERAYYKPKGYAGDFMMMELVYQHKADGDGKLGCLIDGWLLKQAPSQAVRNRRRLMHRLLDQICRERLGKETSVRLMNLACGPSRELFDLLTHCDYSHRIHALCIDIDAEALQYIHQHVNTESHNATIQLMHENVLKWALGKTNQDLGGQDVIYCSGLCDYLDRRLMQRLINRCYAHLVPGGVLILGNFSPTNPDRLFMDNLLYWRLIYRDEKELAAIFAETEFGDNMEVVAEEQGVNLFAVARK